MSELHFAFGLPDCRSWTTTDAMDRRKRLIEAARQLEMLALYERRPFVEVDIRWEPENGEHNGCWRMVVRHAD